MKKRIISLILAALMSMTALAACDSGEVVDGGEGDGQQQEEIQGNEPDNEAPTVNEDETVESVNVMELNVSLKSFGETVQVETPEKVLKFTTMSTGDATSKMLIVNIDEFQIPAGATLEYDVYLESDSLGLGIFDIKVGNTFVSTIPEVVDKAGMNLDFNSSDISGLAYGRWYHREFDLNVTEASSSKMIRFPVGGLTNGCTSVCYYDNICIKDANGNVVWVLDEDFIANYELRQSKDITSTFEVVDDPSPTVKSLSAGEIPRVLDPMGAISGKDSIEMNFTVDNVESTPAIYVGDADESCHWGIRGIVLEAKNGYLTLYNSAETVTELASAIILGRDSGKDLGIKLEVVGNVVRGYWLDDMDGVEPWPEFELAVDGLTGKNFGVMDIYGQGTTVKTVAVGEIPLAEYESVYLNPVHEGLADPDILYYDGMYYLYGTNGPGYRVYTSPDMVNWEYNGFCMETGAWGIDHSYWAPDVEYYNGKFYMVCTVDRNLGLAVADSPLGPFEPVGDLLLGFITFDGHIFIDDDGQAYLYYDSSYDGRQYGIYGAKIDLETATIDFSTETLCVFSEELWESYGMMGEIGGNKVTEGPYVLKHNGLYYLTYSGSDYGYYKYAVGYAVSESPLGPFVKYEGNPIHLGNSAVHGTAHHSFVETPGGELFIVYHQHRTLTEVELRRPCIDRARFAPTESGIDRIETYGPTTTPQPMPLG